tara:strand:- start:707 stop:1084 length:378 start_codon:yes stop_codon:yes gene_type:complete
LKKHYFRIEYSVRVLIGPADIKFELWFDEKKLSRDQAIRVEWTPTAAPKMIPGPVVKADIPNDEPIELPTRRPTRNDMQPIAGKTETSQPTLGGKDVSPDRAEKMKRGMNGLIAKARGGKWTVVR